MSHVKVSTFRKTMYKIAICFFKNDKLKRQYSLSIDKDNLILQLTSIKDNNVTSGLETVHI